MPEKVPEEVVIFDTTLRDGEQADHKMPPEVKLEIAHALSECGVRVIEAGFPCSSEGDAEAVARIAREVRDSTICALARIKQEDIETAARSIEGAAHPRLHVFVATSDLHIEKKLQSSHEEVLEWVMRGVARAKELTDEVQFSAEDATRSDSAYLWDVVCAAIEAGATIINLPDTVGDGHYAAVGEMFWNFRKKIPKSSGITLSTHCHDDYGLATANSIAAVESGARQVEGCFIGIGERAGNAALERIVMGIRRFHSPNLFTSVQSEQLGPVCRMISSRIGYPIPAHHPIVGASAFAHSSGIHYDGIKKDRRTYEVMRPETVGWIGQTTGLVSHLGRSGVRDALNALGYNGDDLIEQIHPLFKALADRKSRLTSEDLHMLVQETRVKEAAHRDHLFELVELDYRPHWASVKIRINDSTEEAEANGDGPVNAAFTAIRKAIGKHGGDVSDLELKSYTVEKGEGGSEAIGWALVRLTLPSLGEGRGIAQSGDTDVVKASAQAFLYALNHLFRVPVE